MSADTLSDRLNSVDALTRHLEGLLTRDVRLGPVIERAGPFAVRTTIPGFFGLAKIICGQQLSVASANAIWGRFEALKGATDPQGFLGLEEAAIRATGFSSGKYRTLCVVAEAIASGELDFAHVETLPAKEAIAHLTRLKGIGPWTAEIYLLFCTGHPDIFPAGDLALQKAIGHALDLGDRPSVKQVIEIAELWSPHRGAAALLFWRYYAAIRAKEGIAL
jgi:DNA-3-methyladenine glycosylase II